MISLLPTLILTRLFNFFFKFKDKLIVSLCSLLVFINLQASEKIVLSDKALFRVDQKVVFLSDLKVFLKDLLKLNCLIGGSFLLESFEINETKISNILNSLNHLKVDQGFKKILKVYKLNLRMESGGEINVDSVFLGGLKKNQKICRVSVIDDKLKNLIKAEVYLQDRFLPRELVFTEQNMKRYRLIYPDRSDLEVKELLTKSETEKSKLSLNSFIKAVSSNYEHFIYQ